MVFYYPNRYCCEGQSVSIMPEKKTQQRRAKDERDGKAGGKEEVAKVGHVSNSSLGKLKSQCARAETTRCERNVHSFMLLASKKKVELLHISCPGQRSNTKWLCSQQANLRDLFPGHDQVNEISRTTVRLRWKICVLKTPCWRGIVGFTSNRHVSKVKKGTALEAILRFQGTVTSAHIKNYAFVRCSNKEHGKETLKRKERTRVKSEFELRARRSTRVHEICKHRPTISSKWKFTRKYREMTRNPTDHPERVA